MLRAHFYDPTAMHYSLPVLASLLAVTSLVGQTSLATTTVAQGALGCQGYGPLLTGGVLANAAGSVSYDAATGILQLTVDNNTPIVAGQSNATISAVHLNLPPGAITSATLTNQTGSGGPVPAFVLSFDDDTGVAPNPNGAGCLGNFNITLAIAGNQGAIANPAAPMVSTPSPVIGPVTFELQLVGPGTSGIDAETVLSTTSQGGSRPTNFGLTFQGGGVGGQESGFVGSCDPCRNSVYIVGQTAVGQTSQVRVTGGYGCHACVWVSAVAGPTVVQGIQIPIGLPLAGAFDLGNFGLNGLGNSVSLTLNVPNNPLFVGFQFYVVNITYDALNLQGYSFSRVKTVTIL